MYLIVQSPDEVLRSPTRAVDLVGPRLQKIIDEMKATLLSQRDPEGVGLAANQVGLPYRLFLARFGTKKNEPVRVFINPEIVEESEEILPKEKNHQMEGCLSLPQYYGLVKRKRLVKVKYQRMADSGKRLEYIEETFVGFPAVVIQHEMDHLNGKIFVERILEQNGKLYKVTGKDRKGKDVWEEVEL